jgi:hypothetical protein
MKHKGWIIVGVLFVVVLGIFFIPRIRTNYVIKDINENSTFELELISEITDDIKNDYVIMEGFGEYTLLGSFTGDPYEDDINVYLEENETTYYRITSYPDVMSGGHYVTSIETTDPDIDLYDLYVGKSIPLENLDCYMNSLGFSPVDYLTGDITKTYSKANVRIRVYFSANTIVKLRVEAEVTNRTGVIF